MKLFQNNRSMLLLLAAFAVISMGCKPMDTLKSESSKSTSLNAAYEMTAASSGFTARQDISPMALVNARYQMVGYQQTGAQATPYSHPTLFQMKFGAIQETDVNCGEGCTTTLPTGPISFRTACQELKIDAAFVEIPGSTDTTSTSHAIALDTLAATDEVCAEPADLELSHFVKIGQAGTSKMSVSKVYLYVEASTGLTFIFKKLAN